MNDQRQKSPSPTSFTTLLSAQKVTLRKYGDNSEADWAWELSPFLECSQIPFESLTAEAWQSGVWGHLIKREPCVYLGWSIGELCSTCCSHMNKEMYVWGHTRHRRNSRQERTGGDRRGQESRMFLDCPQDARL